jgi:hypothetical protein
MLFRSNGFSAFDLVYYLLKDLAGFTADEDIAHVVAGGVGQVDDR